MTKKTPALTILTILLLSQPCLADTRNMCKKYFRKMTLDNCISRQNASRRTVENGNYSKGVVNNCKETNKLVDRLATEINWLGVDKCSKAEQLRLDEQYEMRKDTSTKIIIN